MKKYRAFLINESVRHRAQEMCIEAPEGWYMEIREPTRNLEQNALMWAILGQLSARLKWRVLVGGKWIEDYMTAADWKSLLTASFEGELQSLAMGIDGTGLVAIGSSTSEYGKSKFSEFIEFIRAFCAKHDVEVDTELKPLSWE